MWNYLNSPELVFKVQSFFGIEKVEKDDKKTFRANNRFFHYLFLLGTELGDELFYGLFIPIFFFNVDSFIGRRFVFHWFVNMYIGQSLKQFFMYERPKPPAIQLQTKWSNEYSLPSTHAMGSLSMSGTILYFALDRYGVNLSLGIICVVLWVTIISLSRVYLGMHTVLDCVLGAAISVYLLLTLLPFTDYVEGFFATSWWSPMLLILVPVILIVYFPMTNQWTPTRGDTCVIAAVFSGIELGTWFNYRLGLLNLTNASSHHTIDTSNLYSLAARTVIGLVIVGLTEFIGKSVSFSLLCSMINEDKKKLKSSENSVKNVKKTFVDLTSKFVTYSILGFNTMVLVPTVYKYLSIQRDSFFSEI